MSKFKIPRPAAGYEMTTVNLTEKDRTILRKIMRVKQLKMGEAIRYAIRKYGANGKD